MTTQPQAAKSMADDNGSGDDTATAKRTKKTVSKRTFIMKDLSEAENIEGADGARYALIVDEKNSLPFDYIFGQNPAFDRMCAIFGFHTKVGNVANTVLNDKDEPGTPADAGDAITAWKTGACAADPVWAERAAGGPGIKVDRDVLADSIVAAATALGKTNLMDRAAVRARLDSDAAFFKGIRQVPEVANEYTTRIGKPAKSLDDFLS